MKAWTPLTETAPAENARATPKTGEDVQMGVHDVLSVASHRSLIARLKVLKTAWVLGNGEVPQPWFNQNASKEVAICRLHSGLAAFDAEPSVTLPVGLQNAIMADEFDLNTCLTKFGLDWAKAHAKTREKAGAMNWVERRKCNASGDILVKAGQQNLIERLKVLKAAWVLGNGDVPQTWFLQIGPKKVLRSRLQCGLAAFAANPSVSLPAGLQDAIMAEDFDLGECQKSFGLDWKKNNSDNQSANSKNKNT